MLLRGAAMSQTLSHSLALTAMRAVVTRTRIAAGKLKAAISMGKVATTRRVGLESLHRVPAAKQRFTRYFAPDRNGWGEVVSGVRQYAGALTGSTLDAMVDLPVGC